MPQVSEFYDEQLETMSLEDRERYYNRKLREIIQYAYEHAPAVKEKLDRAGIRPSDINAIRDLERVPITKKDELMELQRVNPPFGGFATVAPHELKRIFVSPGPTYDAFPPEQYSMSAKFFHCAGFRKGDIVMICLSYHLVPVGVIWDEAMTDHLGITVIPAGTGNSELQTRIMHDLRVTGYMGAPSFLMTIIKRAEELGYDFRSDFTLRRALVGAEMLPPSLRQSLEEDYGIDVRDSYGSGDLGGMAVECREKSGMHVPEELLVEIVDPTTGKQVKPGEVGEVVVTPLNKVYPLIRFGTGDLTFYNDEPCPCGRTSRRLGRIQGRVGETVKVRGLFVHARQLQEAVSRFPEVSCFQAVVERAGHRDELILNVELKDEEIEKEGLLQRLHKAIQDACQVRADMIEFVAAGTIPEEHKTIVDKRKWE